MYGLRSEFNIDDHNKTFFNYFEAVIDREGKVYYAVPSHQEKVIEMVCDELFITRDELSDMCPKEYYFDFLRWMLSLTGLVAVWTDFFMDAGGINGVRINDKQKEMLKELKDNGIYNGLEEFI